MIKYLFKLPQYITAHKSFFKIMARHIFPILKIKLLSEAVSNFKNPAFCRGLEFKNENCSSFNIFIHEKIQ